MLLAFIHIIIFQFKLTPLGFNTRDDTVYSQRTEILSMGNSWNRQIKIHYYITRAGHRLVQAYTVA